MSVSNFSRMLLREIPEEWLHLFCELAASGETIRDDPGAREFFLRLASRMPRTLLAWLFEKRFPVGPFVDNIGPGRIFPGVGVSSRTLRKRWRLLKRRLRAAAPAQTFAEEAFAITLADLRPLVIGGRAQRLRSGWRTHGKAVAARFATRTHPFPAFVKQLYWGGAGSRQLAFWERLVHGQAGELTEIRRLSREVSRKTGRVVLGWHNATLGAAGGWAYEDPTGFLGNSVDFQRFVDESARIRKIFDRTLAMELCSMRIERLFAPKFVSIRKHEPRCELDRTSALCKGGQGGFQSSTQMIELQNPPKSPFFKGGLGRESPDTFQDLRTDTELTHIMESASISDEADDGNYEWPGPLAPHQQIRRAQLSAWVEGAKSSWAEGLILLIALANHGQRLLDAGVVDSFVLPWIDKFFISSKRRADVMYLERLYGFVSAYIENPLILFWDDTVHARAPSLSLALEKMAAEGLPARGLGIFNARLSKGHGAERAEAARIISGEYPKKAFFALRPRGETHCPTAFRMVFEDFDQDFFAEYDSSWKDNLAFLYAGTQVFPLLGVQTEMEAMCPWVFGEGRRYAFGAWFRRMVRRVSLKGENKPFTPLFREYCGWANLL